MEINEILGEKKIPTNLVFSQVRASVLCIKAEKAFLNLCLFLFYLKRKEIVLKFFFCHHFNFYFSVISENNNIHKISIQFIKVVLKTLLLWICKNSVESAWVQLVFRLKSMLNAGQTMCHMLMGKKKKRKKKKSWGKTIQFHGGRGYKILKNPNISVILCV